jgi:hypothetical protein
MALPPGFSLQLQKPFTHAEPVAQGTLAEQVAVQIFP